MSRNTLTEKILTVLQRLTEATVDTIYVNLTSHKGSYLKLRDSMLGLRETPRFKREWAEIYRERRIFYATLNRLKDQGFITKKTDERGSPWKISEKGSERLNPRPEYEKIKSPTPIIISYDIPEKMRKERHRIREVLKLMNFELVHKSVWIGTNRVPKKWLDELRGRKVLECLHIFEVGKLGTLGEIKSG